MTSSEPISDWITHRRPTEADGDRAGDVVVRQRPGDRHGYCLHWSHVGEGVPWQHFRVWQPTTPAPTTTPRKFAAISRTVHEFGHTIDAIADDGTAWWMVLGVGEDPGIPWTQMTPLPDREAENE